MKFQKTTLKNGLRIITCEMPHVQSVAITIFVEAGSRYEPKKLWGISHFLEHMVFKGTKNYPTHKDISETIESVGGTINAWTSKDHTAYTSKVPKKKFKRAMDVLVDLLLFPKLEAKDIEIERKVIIEEINSSEDSPESKVGKLYYKLLWPDHPLGRDIGGTTGSIKKIKKGDLLKYINSLYNKPKNMVLSVAGNVSHKEVILTTKKLLEGLKGKSKIKFENVIDKQNKPQLSIYQKDTNQAHLCLGAKGISYNSTDRFPLEVLSVILGLGSSSRLRLLIREQGGLAYSIGSYNSYFSDTGIFTIYAGINIKKIYEAISAILKELNKLKNKIVPNPELNKVKEFMKGSFLLGIEDTENVSEWQGKQELLYPKTLTPEEMIAEIEKVTQKDIKRIANNLFVNEKLNLAIVGPFKNKEKFEKILKL